MATGIQKWPTALALVKDIEGQLGLPVSTAALAAPDDDTAQQLISLLTWSGRRLVKPTSGYRWTSLQRTWSLDTVVGQTLYDLPPDWDSFIDVTAWNKSATLPLLGPATNVQWSTLRARNLGGTISIVYRTVNRQFEIMAAPSTVQTILIDYSSRAWVKHIAGGTTTYQDAITADDDEVLFDNELITAKLKLAFLQAKGFDTTNATAEYNEIEEQAINADTDAPVLYPGRARGYPLISNLNVPDTGYGL